MFKLKLCSGQGNPDAATTDADATTDKSNPYMSHTKITNHNLSYKNIKVIYRNYIRSKIYNITIFELKYTVQCLLLTLTNMSKLSINPYPAGTKSDQSLPQV